MFVSKHLPASRSVGLTGPQPRRQRCDQCAAHRAFGGKISTKMITRQEALRKQDIDLQGGRSCHHSQELLQQYDIISQTIAYRHSLECASQSLSAKSPQLCHRRYSATPPKWVSNREPARISIMTAACRSALLMVRFSFDATSLHHGALQLAGSRQAPSSSQGVGCGEMQGSSGLPKETTFMHFRALIGQHGSLTIPGKAAVHSDTP